MNNITFAYPFGIDPIIYWSCLIIIVLFLGFWYWKRRNVDNADIQISCLKGFERSGKTPRQYLRYSLFLFRILAIVLLIIVLARPQSSTSWQDVTTEGIDIILSMDISGSMLAEDFKPNRLEASKDVAMDFISGRPTDRIGLVVFSGESFTQCPLTTDHAVLQNLFGSIKSGMIEDGTAIGMGLATAVNRLKDSKAISKVIILLTDGVNNQGLIAPLTAAEIARTFNIRVYTIGVGTRGQAPYPFKTPFGIKYQNVEVKIDEEMLKEIADMTDGKYFRATNKNKLEDIYEEIDQLEKSKIEVTEYRKKTEQFLPFALIAGILLLLEILLRNTVFRSIP
ncbi:MAG: VWA domain-containing protein [Bacteroidota bacterium]